MYLYLFGQVCLCLCIIYSVYVFQYDIIVIWNEKTVSANKNILLIPIILNDPIKDSFSENIWYKKLRHSVITGI